MRSFVVGDIHGAHKALVQCLKRSGFDYENDLLISLGDICDGWPETKECIEELLKIKNLIIVLGNHDQWALEWMNHGTAQDLWINQGGRQTMESYSGEKVPATHINLLKNASLYYLDDNNKLFVHAGIDPKIPLSRQDLYTLLWDRDFFSLIKRHLDNGQNLNFTSFSSVYLGHSPIHRYGYNKPKKVGEVWLMDTGASWEGVLSMMNLETEEVFCSDPPIEMYPKGSGRV